MNISVKPGRYIVAVSGGVDSIVLLDALKYLPNIEIIVAHYDHGIRPNSRKDREFVQNLANSFKLPFVYAEGNLGPKTSEAKARQARYGFLRSVKKKYGAKAIITAHHQDDVLETMIINLLRGTKRKGLVSLRSNSEVIRPLIGVGKQDIIDYAKKHSLSWQEDETNKDMKYLRNRVRHTIIPQLSQSQRKRLVDLHTSMLYKDREIDMLLNLLVGSQKSTVLARKTIIGLPHEVACEIIAYWLRSNGIRQFDKALIERLVIGVKTLPIGTNLDVVKGCKITIQEDRVELSR